MENVSEIALLRRRIEEEYTAAQRALYAPAMIAKHEFITARMENMQKAHNELQKILGADEAIKLVASVLENMPEVRPAQGEPS
jgi:hypothetical protein